MLWNVYLRKGSVYVPTIARTDAGFYLDVEPVEVAAAQDAEAVQRAVIGAIRRGNQMVPTPSRANFPKPVILKYSRVRSWSEFERNAEYWNVVEKNGRYQIIPGRKEADGGWTDDLVKMEEFPADIGIEELARKVAHSVRSALNERSFP